MGKQNQSNSKGILSNLVFVFSWIPFFQWVAFFYMNRKIHKKRWAIMGIVNLLISVMGVLFCLGRGSLLHRFLIDMGVRPGFGKFGTLLFKFARITFVIYSSSVSRPLLMISWIVFLILGFFFERYTFLRAKRDMDNSQKMSADRPVSKTPVTRTNPIQPVQRTTAPVTAPAALSTEIINVNAASEEQLMTLPNMKTIDVMKIMNYRNEHGSFLSTDEFFTSFDAKPHVIVRMEKLITVSSSASEESKPVNRSNSDDSQRRFDL